MMKMENIADISNKNMGPYKVFIDSDLWSCKANLVSCSMIYRYLIFCSRIFQQKNPE